jgi:large subunit ribosomal protein L23
MMAEWRHLKYPHLTEKSVTLVDSVNTIVFIVNLKSTKPEIRKEFEEIFEVKVAKVNTEVTPNGIKKAYIKLKPEFKAADVAVKLGVV